MLPFFIAVFAIFSHRLSGLVKGKLDLRGVLTRIDVIYIIHEYKILVYLIFRYLYMEFYPERVYTGNNVIRSGFRKL